MPTRCSLTPFGLVEAAEALCADGFEVFPYTTEDQVLAGRLVDAGCRVLMPWGAPIGSGLGLNNLHGLRSLRAAFPEVAMVIDAGLGLPSHAAQALEMGSTRCSSTPPSPKPATPLPWPRPLRWPAARGRLPPPPAPWASAIWRCPPPPSSERLGYDPAAFLSRF